ncbi:unnamed protein product [Rotaria magnacalcarata]|uniref:ABC transporter ATP-binding protein n=1 Tax=Rotaria magnacalcarata TaxID=392030 RepID=A0A816FI10_9BILA|nr:unnamed protein product [Rotaria magnacalcarata]CAF3788721.1 unnamed protein product [Rotaria magnacalcarata]
MNNKTTISSFFWQIIKPYKWWYLVMIPGPFVTAAFVFGYNYAIKLLLDVLTQDKILHYGDFVYPVGIFLGSHFMVDIFFRISNYAEWKSQPQVRKDIMCKVYDYVMGHSYNFFQNNLSGSIISKIKSINDGYYYLFESIKHNLTAKFLISLLCAICLLCINSKIFIMVGLFTVGLVIVSMTLYRKLGVMQGEISNDYHGVIGLIADNITNIANVSLFASKKAESQSIINHQENISTPLRNKWFKLNFITEIIVTMIYSLFGISVLLYSIYLKNSGQITIGDIAFTMSMTFLFQDNIFGLFIEVKKFVNTWSDFKTSFSIMQIPQEKIDKTDATELKVSGGEVIFENINFGYENNNKVFTNLNLKIKAGQKIGIVGSSGAGKSTLVALLLKHFKADNGNMIIDNQSIYDVTSDSLRSQISLIPQDIVLFHRSVGENIGYAKKEANQAEIENAAKMASIHDFIETLPEKYNTLVGERGVKLSGGQRQRIAIARAILKNAPILILDEATSALDSETEQQIQKSISDMLETNKATVIAIAHRLSTIKHLDRIVVMENGAIAEDGMFDELLAKENSKFKALWDRQVNGMVL